MSILPVAIQLLPLIPSLIDSALRIVSIIRRDPTTPVEIKEELDSIESRLRAVVEQVRLAPLPK